MKSNRPTITLDCRNCGRCFRSEWPAEAGVCPGCSGSHPFNGDSVRNDSVQCCPVCTTEDVYIQKDFPHRIGLSIVGVGILFSTLAWSQYQYPLALGILLLTAALDLCLYYWIGSVAVCYRCLAQFRGFKTNPEHRPFDLAVGERYRQERIRIQAIHKEKGG